MSFQLKRGSSEAFVWQSLTYDWFVRTIAFHCVVGWFRQLMQIWFWCLFSANLVPHVARGYCRKGDRILHNRNTLEHNKSHMGFRRVVIHPLSIPCSWESARSIHSFCPFNLRLSLRVSCVITVITFSSSCRARQLCENSEWVGGDANLQLHHH